MVKAFWILLCLLIAGLIIGPGVHAQAPPALTEIETLRLENLKLRVALAQQQAQTDGCRAEIGTVYQTLGQTRAAKASADLTAAEAALKAQIERAHPGFVFDTKTGVLAPKED